MWEDEIMPAFEESHPGITVEFAPIDTNEYNAAIQSQIEGGTGPDLITCRPFDVNRVVDRAGLLRRRSTGLDAIGSFDRAGARRMGRTTTAAPYCVPVASVLAGFFYNKDIFDELGLEVPTTQAEFIARARGDQGRRQVRPARPRLRRGWQLAYNGSTASGPTYWKGEEGRLGLIDGTQEAHRPRVRRGASRRSTRGSRSCPADRSRSRYADMTQLFTLGQAAILPDGSWDINQVTATGLDVGVFGAPPAAAGDQRYQQEMADMAIGINAASKNKEAATEFLDWIGTPEFQQLYVNKLPGFFSMGKEPVTYDDPLAQEFADLKEGAELTSRLALDRLSAGTAAARRRDLAGTPADVHHGLDAGGGDGGTPGRTGLLVRTRSSSASDRRAAGRRAAVPRPASVPLGHR